MEKQLPHNMEAESGVLGSVLIDPEAIALVVDFLQPEDFYRNAHRTIFSAMLSLFEQHAPPDLITVCDLLERQGKLEEVGGPAYITSLVNHVPTSMHVEHYGHIVSKAALHRRLIQVAGRIAALGFEEADHALDTAEELVYGLGNRSIASEVSSVGSVFTEFFDQLGQLPTGGSIVGVPSGFYELDKVTRGFQRSDLIILAGRPAMGKCLSASMLVDDPVTGERLTIEECVRRQLPFVYGLSLDGRIRPTAVSHWIDSGIKPCYRVQTRLGRTVEVTGHHPFLTVQGWKPLYELQVGSHIAVPTKLECSGGDDSLPLEKVRLLAYFIAEGGLTDRSPKFTNTDPVIVEDFKQIIAHHFPELAIRQDRITYIVARPRKRLKNPLSQWLKDLGLMGKYAHQKFFPACVWRWSKRYLVEFLRVLMSCDGCIYSFKGVPIIDFTVASQQLAADVQHAFLRFGIVSKLWSKTATYQGKTFAAWRVEITHPESVKRYQDEIGWIGEKSTRFAEYSHVISSRGGNNGHAPKEIWEDIRTGVRRQGISMIELARRSGETTKTGHSNGYNAHIKRGIPRSRLAAYAEVLDDTNLRRASSPDVYWDEIVSIEAIGDQQVYDLTVPDGANFIAQDIFVHNTAMCLSIAANAAISYGCSVLIFSCEMSKMQLIQRLTGMLTGVNVQRLFTRQINEDEMERVVAVGQTVDAASLWIDDTPALTLSAMRSKLRRTLAEHPIDLVIVDYLQLMQAMIDGKRVRDRLQEVSEVARGLKNVAREFNMPLLALAQLSRAVEGRAEKRPQLSDLRECVVGSTRLIEAKTGKWVPITQIQPGDEVLGLGKQQKIGRFTVQDVWQTGTKPVFRLTTRTGRQIVATQNHPLLTATGWKPLGELGSGDRIATAMRLPEHGKEMPERAELCRMLGYMVGDGIVGQKENAKRVPEWVFESGAVGAREFLAGYLSTNSGIKKGMKHGHVVWEIHFDTVSRRLAHDMQALLLRIGVVASIDNERVSQKATQPLYRITISGVADNLKRLAEQVPAGGKKGRLLQELLEQLPPTQTDPGLFGLPPELSTHLHERRDQFIASARNSLPRGSCLELAERLDDPLLHEWAASDLLWEEVRSIEPYGEAETFDISIPGANNFLADGIIAHNSGELEQAADIVMFIHRDDYYAGFDRETGKSLSTRPKTADILIAKHRNGPIGDVVLGFEASQTKFYNLDETRMGG